MRLIDADALNDSMFHEAFETYSELQKWDRGCWIRYKMFKNHLDMAPTADAVPVVRGEWIRMDETQALLSVEWKCSQCGQEIRVDGILTANGAGWKYCPNCGCDMRGERDGEK